MIGGRVAAGTSSRGTEIPKENNEKSKKEYNLRIGKILLCRDNDQKHNLISLLISEVKCKKLSSWHYAPKYAWNKILTSLFPSFIRL